LPEKAEEKKTMKVRSLEKEQRISKAKPKTTEQIMTWKK
jgi:hypothetical protein